jgi:rubrerythrin
MLAKNPLDVDGLPSGLRDEEIARLGLIAELDAINLYQQLAQVAGDSTLKKVLLDIAREEKTHVGEFLAILLRLDREQGKELEEGKEEVDELSG